MENQSGKINKMGVVPVRKLLIIMGIPMIISMALQALYNIIDTAFISSIPNEEIAQAAIVALGYAFPVQMLIIAVGIGTGVGANAVLSKSLGQGDKEKVGQVAGNALFLSTVIYAVFLIFGIFCAGPFARAMAKDSELIAGMTANYLRICCICSFAVIFFTSYEKLLQSTGKTLFSTIAQIAGAVTNIILDPVMIYDWGAGLGIEGAAWATVIGQFVSVALAAGFHYGLNKEVATHIKYLRPRGKLILEMYSIGFPAIIAQALMSFMVIGMNIVFGILDKPLIEKGLASADAPPYAGAYSVYYKIQMLVLHLAFGLRDAITPVVSFNYGRRDKVRIKDGIFYGLIYTAVLMALGFVLLEAIPAQLAGIFSDGLSDLGMKYCLSAMRIISVSFIFAGSCIALQGIFQAVGSGLASLIISLLRQFVLVVPVAVGFAFIVRGNADGDWLVWLTFIIAEVLSAATAFVMLRFIYKKKIKPLTQPELSEKIEEAEQPASVEQIEEAEQSEVVKKIEE